MFSFTKFSLARQFMLASLLILLAGMTIIGLLVSKQIEDKVIYQTGAVTAMYVDSFISPHLQDLSTESNIDPESVLELDRLLGESHLGQQIASFKVWSPDGRIIYSPNPNLIGRQFSIDDELDDAFSGEVRTNLSTLNRPEHVYEKQFWDVLIETYAPVRADGSGEIIAVSEFYQLPGNLKSGIREAQVQSWLVVGAATLVMYLLLASMVGRASNTILRQQDELQEKVFQLSELLTQNRFLHNRLRRAASRNTALNEQFLRRISSDLHDGPIQDLALALLRIESLEEACEECPTMGSKKRTPKVDFEIMHTALESSLKEIRTISAGLRLPELEPLSPVEVAKRAVRDYKRKTNQDVDFEANMAPGSAPIPVKITLYRVIQEALTNAFRHAGSSEKLVTLWGEDEKLQVEVEDTGTGFNPQSIFTDEHLGLVGMRERVELLGGDFYINSAPGQGTRIKAMIPLASVETIEGSEL